MCDFTPQHHEQILQDTAWVDRTENDIERIWFPEWTDPNWDPLIEINEDGDKQRAVGYDDRSSRRRPAILPADRPLNPTRYAK